MATKKRLIDANVAIERAKNSDKIVRSIVWETGEVVEFLEDFPIVDAVEVVHGCWVDKHYKIACSVCENAVFIGTSDPLIHKEEKKNLKYCPNCGARMDGVSDG